MWDIMFFFNFQLTKRRSKLLYKMRQLRKEGRISKFYCDENGMLSLMIKRKEDGGSKDKVTYHSKNKDSPPKTFTEEELEDLVRRSASWADIAASES